ncbi:MAG: AAA family ATPase [Candidatus Lokiarchaeota archaeon]|nr:AAA family ATPase [Candidatus Harpocratesius repetitus]
MVIETDSPPTNPSGEFEDFFRNFEEIPNEFKYRQIISDAYAKSENYITVLFEDILTFNPQLAHYLKNHPEEALEEASEALKNIIRIDAGGFFNPDEPYFIRISTQNNSNEVSLRSIRSEHVDTLIYVKGIVIRTSIVRPQVIQAMFECPICGNQMLIDQLTTKLTPPRECMNPTCNNKKDFKVITAQSEFIDHQYVTIQEAPEDLRSGDIPQTLQTILLNDLVDSVRPGERVKMMGILKSVPREDRRGRLSTLFQSQLFVNNVEGIRQEDEELDLSQEDIDEIHALSQEPEIQKKIANSIARAILGHEHLKMAAALSLFGGNRKVKKDGSKLRGDIHVLFMGDPGTGKSQILQNCAQISPRSVYTSGKGASAAGLTAAVIKESDNAGLQLEAGALVLASGGVACIDEFDKMRKQDRSAIHEAMEQQSYHPSFEFTLSDNSRIPIGKFVDNLFAKSPQKIIDGVDCEILPIRDLNYEVISTNFNEILTIPIDRVSRHKAPDSFIEITYSNGRKILVTPEHPVFILENNKICTRSAENILPGMDVPSININRINNNKLLPLLTQIDIEDNSIDIPSHLSQDLAFFLGNLLSENATLQEGSNEIILFNRNQTKISEMQELIKKIFKNKNEIIIRKEKTYRIVSKSIIQFLQFNFLEILKSGVHKRISPSVFNSPDHIRISFLNAVFKGIGKIKSETVIIYTSSQKLAEDYQDLLLTLGIHSCIQEKKENNENNDKDLEISKKSKKYYEILIMRDSLERFSSIVIGSELVSDELLDIIERSKENFQADDKIPQNLQLFHWIKIKSIKKITNSDSIYSDWVYDVTIEPTENFISHGLVLHNTISIAKAGIVATLQSKTAIIAAANPKHGRWNEYETAANNINLSPPILSRFDLIFIVRDIPEKGMDDRIADYILKNHMMGFDETFYAEQDVDDKKLPRNEDFIPMELLKKYVQYAKVNSHPKLTREAAELIREFYIKMRSSTPEGSTAVPIVARTLDGMVRMSEAYAKMALRDFVKKEDAEAAIELLKRSLRDIGYDEETDQYDVDVMYTGTSSSKRQRLNLILNKIKELQLANPKAELTFEDIFEPIANEKGITEEFVRAALEQWVKDSELYHPHPDTWRMTTPPKKPKPEK